MVHVALEENGLVEWSKEGTLGTLGLSWKRAGDCHPGDWGLWKGKSPLPPPEELHFPRGLAAFSQVGSKNVLGPNPLTPTVPSARLT